MLAINSEANSQIINNFLTKKEAAHTGTQLYLCIGSELETDRDMVRNAIFMSSSTLMNVRPPPPPPNGQPSIVITQFIMDFSAVYVCFFILCGTL